MKVKPDRIKEFNSLVNEELLSELIEDLIDRATDLGVGYADPQCTLNNPIGNLRGHNYIAALERDLEIAAGKVFNAIEAITAEKSGQGSGDASDPE